MSGCVWYNVAMTKSHLVLALVAAVILPTEAALKGIVLWPHQARKYPDLSAAISLEYSYALPCDVVSGTNSTGALVLFAKGARPDGALALVSKKLLAPIPLALGE